MTASDRVDVRLADVRPCIFMTVEKPLSSHYLTASNRVDAIPMDLRPIVILLSSDRCLSNI